MRARVIAQVALLAHARVGGARGLPESARVRAATLGPLVRPHSFRNSPQAAPSLPHAGTPQRLPTRTHGRPHWTHARGEGGRGSGRGQGRLRGRAPTCSSDCSAAALRGGRDTAPWPPTTVSASVTAARPATVPRPSHTHEHCKTHIHALTHVHAVTFQSAPTVHACACNPHETAPTSARTLAITGARLICVRHGHTPARQKKHVHTIHQPPGQTRTQGPAVHGTQG